MPDVSKDINVKLQSDIRIFYENERLIHFSKSPHSWALPRDWLKICELYPNIIRNKVCEYDKANNNNNNHSNQNNNKSNTKTINQSTNNMFRKRDIAISQ